MLIHGQHRQQEAKKTPLNHNGSEVFLRLWALFLYRDFLPVLEGKYHLVIVDRDPAEKPADVAFIEGDHRSGQALEELFARSIQKALRHLAVCSAKDK